MATGRPTTYSERRAAGEFEEQAAERAAEIAARPAPEPAAVAPAREHVPLGADVELYNQLVEWGAGGSGTSGALTDLTDVTGLPDPGTSPVYDDAGNAALTPVTTH